MTNETGIVDQVKEIVADDEHSLGEKAPGAPFVLVALSYLGVLLIACGLLAITLWLTQ